MKLHLLTTYKLRISHNSRNYLSRYAHVFFVHYLSTNGTNSTLSICEDSSCYAMIGQYFQTLAFSFLENLINLVFRLTEKNGLVINLKIFICLIFKTDIYENVSILC